MMAIGIVSRLKAHRYEWGTFFTWWAMKGIKKTMIWRSLMIIQLLYSGICFFR